MDGFLSVPLVMVALALGVLSWLATTGTRRVIRRQFPHTHKSLEKNELVKHLLPVAWGAVMALMTPCFVFAMAGLVFPENVNIYVLCWSKVIIGGAAGMASGLAYKGVRRAFHAWVQGRLSGAASSDGVPPDADRP